MSDTLKEIDAGIERHTDAGWPSGNSCSGCGQEWPCETLKALQGWREAVVEGERLKAEGYEAGALRQRSEHAEELAVLESSRDSWKILHENRRRNAVEQEKRALAAEAKLADAEAMNRDAKETLDDWRSHQTGHPGWAQPYELGCEFCRLVIRSVADAEAKKRALVEALRSDAGFLRRFLEKLKHHSVEGDHGQIVNGYAAAEAPDWEMRQRLDDIEEALALAAREGE